MTLAVGHVIQVTDVQTFLGQVLNNIYHYVVQSAEVAASLEDLADDFQLQVIGAMTPIQSTSLVHTRIIVKDLSDGVSIFEKAIAVAGVVTTGDNVPSFTALGIRLIRTTAITRHGSKRLGGLREGALVDNAIHSSYVTVVDDYCDAIKDPLIQTGTTDHDYEAQPHIVGRIHEPDPNAGDLDLGILNPVADAQFISVTTQTTRKAGRGT